VVLNDFVLLPREPLLLLVLFEQGRGSTVNQGYLEQGNFLLSNPCRYREIWGNSNLSVSVNHSKVTQNVSCLRYDGGMR
jgi:hypothetical protein